MASSVFSSVHMFCEGLLAEGYGLVFLAVLHSLCPSFTEVHTEILVLSVMRYEVAGH